MSVFLSFPVYPELTFYQQTGGYFRKGEDAYPIGTPGLCSLFLLECELIFFVSFYVLFCLSHVLCCVSVVAVWPLYLEYILFIFSIILSCGVYVIELLMTYF